MGREFSQQQYFIMIGCIILLPVLAYQCYISYFASNDGLMQRVKVLGITITIPLNLMVFLLEKRRKGISTYLAHPVVLIILVVMVSYAALD